MGSGEDEADDQREIWLLVDHSSREASLVPVARDLEDQGHSVELVTITEVIGNVAREALAGGAERLLRGLRVATRGETGDENLVGAIRRRQPDVLVVTESRYARAIGVLENLTDVESLQVGLIPEFQVDPAWFHGRLHGFVVPDDELRDAIVDRGIDDERVRVAGPAIRPEFLRDVDRDEARRQLGFGDDDVILVRGDGFDTATLEQLVFQATLVDRDLRLIFHHDGDGAVASTLRRAADQYGLPAAMFGRVSDLERYVTAADAVLASGSDPYLGELLEAGTPTMLISPESNRPDSARLLARRGFVDHLADVEQLGTRLDEFADPEKLDAMREQLEEFDGATRHEALVEALADIAARADEWRYPARPDTTTGDDQDVEDPETEADDADESDQKAPFETIGDGEETGDAGGGEGASQPAGRRDYSEISRAEAKDQLAELILEEREAERRLQELEKQQQRWRDRLQLAREWNEDDLAEEAKSILAGYIDEAEPVEEKLDNIRRQKAKLKDAARGGEASEGGEDSDFDDRVSQLEERFRKMEVDSDLEGLKDRIRRELGE